MSLVLHGYWRSGAAYRTRIALNLKNLAYEGRTWDLRTGVQRGDDYRALNPQGLLPALEADGAVLTQSLAILEYLEETHPEPPLLPRHPIARARIRAMCATVTSDIHPLGNLRVLTSLRKDLGADETQVSAWIARWISAGFDALETTIAQHGKGWAYGGSATLADCCLIPQVYGARRFEVDMTPWPRIRAVAERAAEHPAFVEAHPDNQPDAD
ncbi:MAG: maleylacetoacetate isomerase [Caulobacter sp.]|nr:maleylacetoacetate isomerase [Caulobacter sp.]